MQQGIAVDENGEGVMCGSGRHDNSWGGGGCTTCVERNLHWYSTRVDGRMCSCGAPQSGSNITGLVSPGLCGAGCAVQGGEEAGGEEGALSAERAATAEERAVCMACGRAGVP